MFTLKQEVFRSLSPACLGCQSRQLLTLMPHQHWLVPLLDYLSHETVRVRGLLMVRNASKSLPRAHPHIALAVRDIWVLIGTISLASKFGSPKVGATQSFASESGSRDVPKNRSLVATMSIAVARLYQASLLLQNRSIVQIQRSMIPS